MHLNVFTVLPKKKNKPTRNKVSHTYNMLFTWSLTVGALPTYEMLVVLQDTPKFRVVSHDTLQRLGCHWDAGQPAVRALLVLGHQHPHSHLFDQVLHAGSQAYGSVFMDAHRYACVHHPAIEASHRELQSAAGGLAPPQPVVGAHAVEGDGFDGGRDARFGQFQTEYQPDSAVQFEACAPTVHNAEALGFPRYPYECPP